jgi:uncharacterized RDD family membrane protein YckC
VSTAVVYVGFWARVGATLIDSFWVALLVTPLAAVFGSNHTDSLESLLADPAGVSTGTLLAALAPGPGDFVVLELLPMVLVLGFWIAKSATPGKMVIHARIADATTFQPPSRRQLLVRYLGYYLSTLPCLLGLIWVAFDPRKRGWHDWLAGTVVVRTGPAT